MGYNLNSTFIRDKNYTADERVFISDVSLANKNIMEKHIEYINNKQYSTASTYIKDQQNLQGITPITADLFNMIQNRLYETQKYLLSDDCDKCNRGIYGNLPSPEGNVKDLTVWIE